MPLALRCLSLKLEGEAWFGNKYVGVIIMWIVVWSEIKSCSVVSHCLQPHGLYSPWNSPGQNPGVDSLFLLQGIFPTQRLKPGLLHCRQILYQLSHKGSPRILQWVAYPFSSESSWLRNWSAVSCIAGGFYTNWAIREALISIKCHLSRGAFPNHICKRAHLLKVGKKVTHFYPALFFFTFNI